MQRTDKPSPVGIGCFGSTQHGGRADDASGHGPGEGREEHWQISQTQFEDVALKVCQIPPQLHAAGKADGVK